jgi:hypothetical protein
MLTQMISVASEHAGDEQQAKLAKAVERLDEIKSGLDVDGQEPTGTGE